MASSSSSASRQAVALLGLRDEPTDAIEDYCANLAEALSQRSWSLRLVRLPWPERGWARALGWLWGESAAWRRQVVLVQYSPLQWSRRGWPQGLLAVLAVLRLRGAQPVMVFHDPAVAPADKTGTWLRRAAHAFRRWVQRIVLRLSYAAAGLSVFTVAPEAISWLGSRHKKAVFIPVGANLPAAWQCGGSCEGPAGRTPRVAVYGVTGGAALGRDAATIARAVRRALRSVPRLSVIVLGRNSREAESTLRSLLQGADAEISALGLLPLEHVARTLASADVQLFVRGGVSTRRSSAIAGIACGLPLVAYANEETLYPLTEAGVMFAPEGDADALGEALAQVLTDAELRRHLRERNQQIYREWFAWDRIAERLVEALERRPALPG